MPKFRGGNIFCSLAVFQPSQLGVVCSIFCSSSPHPCLSFLSLMMGGLSSTFFFVPLFLVLVFFGEGLAAPLCGCSSPGGLTCEIPNEPIECGATSIDYGGASQVTIIGDGVLEFRFEVQNAAHHIHLTNIRFPQMTTVVIKVSFSFLSLSLRSTLTPYPFSSRFVLVLSIWQLPQLWN